MNSKNENITISPYLNKLKGFSTPLKIGVLASGNGTNFESLVTASLTKELDAKVKVLIVNNSNCKAIDKAINLGIPYKVLDHRDYSNREDHDKEIIKVLDSSNIELVVMAGWMRIVTKKLILHFRNRLINIHPSLLPSFRGINAIDQAYKAGVKITGCSVHYVTEDVDTGPIIIQAAIPINPSDTLRTLEEKMHLQEHRILPIGVAIAGENLRALNNYG